MELTAIDHPLTLDIIESGCVTWEDLVRSVRNFKYGRNDRRDAFEQVWYNRIGTCSTKHAFLYQIAQVNGFENIRLVVGVYLMTAKNTPKIADVLDRYSLTGIPEAHTYLRIGTDYLDATSNTSSYEIFQNDILEECFIQPEFLKEEKIAYHRDFLRKWIETTKSNLSLDQLWSIREACIEVLSN